MAALSEIPCQSECRGEEHAELAYFPAWLSPKAAMKTWEEQKQGLVIVTRFEARKNAPKANEQFVNNASGANPTPEEANWPAFLVRFRFVDRVRHDSVLN